MMEMNVRSQAPAVLSVVFPLAALSVVFPLAALSVVVPLAALSAVVPLAALVVGAAEVALLSLFWEPKTSAARVGVAVVALLSPCTGAGVAGFS
jgi:hypothetical protein